MQVNFIGSAVQNYNLHVHELCNRTKLLQIFLVYPYLEKKT